MEEYELISVKYEMKIDGKTYNIGRQNPFGHTPKIGKRIFIQE